MPIPQTQERNVEVDEAVTNQNSVKKCLEMSVEIAEMKDDHKKFYKQFDRCMKLGILEGCTNRIEIAELLRSNTSKFGDEQTDLKKNVGRVSLSPVLENLRKKGHEVLHVVDAAHEFAVQLPRELDGKKLESRSR